MGDYSDPLIVVLIFLCISFLLVIFQSWNLGRKKRLTKSPKSFKDLLFVTKEIEINGVPFIIKKINLLDYLEGGKVLSEIYSTYKTGKDANISQIETAHLTKLKKYYMDIICAGSVVPKFVRKDPIEENKEILIDELFNDWFLSEALALEIFNFTYGKKK